MSVCKLKVVPCVLFDSTPNQIAHARISVLALMKLGVRSHTELCFMPSRQSNSGLQLCYLSYNK